MVKYLLKFRHSQKTSEKFCIIVFYGSLWGATEATLGYLLHRSDFTFGWFLWFPLAFYFMDKIFRKTGEAGCMFYGALIAAAIKLTDLFIEIRVDKVINPSVSIILEGASMLVLYKIIERRHKGLSLSGIAGVNILWRVLYSIYILLMPGSILLISPLRGSDAFLHFMLLESMVNTCIIAAYVMLRERFPGKQGEEVKRDISTKFAPALAMLLLAEAIQWIV